MFDINAKQPARDAMEVADYIELGRLVTEWARDPSARPASAADLNRQLAGIAVIRRPVKKVVFVQDDEDTIYVRLPDTEKLDERINEMMDDCSGRLYPVPYFYRDYFDPGFGPVMSAYETLLARLGDSVAVQG